MRYNIIYIKNNHTNEFPKIFSKTINKYYENNYKSNHYISVTTIL